MADIIGRIGFALSVVITWLLVTLVVLPLAIVVTGAIFNIGRLGLAAGLWSGPPDAWFDFTSFAYIFGNYAHWLLFSVALALASVAICLVVAVPAGYLFARRRFAGSNLLEQVVLLPLSLPGIALSVALIAAYGWMRGPWLVLGGHLLYTIPFMIKVVTSTLRSFDVSRLEAAAQSLGCRFHQRFLWVILPNLRHAMMTGALLVFAVSWGEFNVSFLLNRGTLQTFPAVLYDTYTNHSFQVSSAATAIFLAVVIPAVIAIQALGGRDSVKAEQGA